jgi:hypothetical protein
MTPIAHFEAVWKRCDQLSALHAYLSKNVSGVLQPEELLRAEWVTRVSSLDLYIHELIAQEMFATFSGRRPVSSGYSRFQISNETLHRIRAAATPSDASAAFDLEVRDRLSYLTFQDPEKIADGIRLFSNIELWNEVTLKLGATPATKAASAKHLKMELSLIVQRRNKIAHEGDLQPSLLREPWPISQADLAVVAELIERIVKTIDTIVCL